MFAGTKWIKVLLHCSDMSDGPAGDCLTVGYAGYERQTRMSLKVRLRQDESNSMTWMMEGSQYQRERGL